MVCTRLNRARLQQVTKQLENTKKNCTNQKKHPRLSKQQQKTIQKNPTKPSHISTALVPSHEIQLGNTFLEQK